MSNTENSSRDAYYTAGETWAHDRDHEIALSRRIAWIVAAVLGCIALLEAIALILLMPMKTVVPYTLLVDKQTGYVETLKPLERKTITPDAALVRSFLVQYVIARESFDVDSLKDSYRKVALWSAETTRTRYVADTQASNPQSALATLPHRAIIAVQVRSVSSLGADTSLIRFTTLRTDTGVQAGLPSYWAAVVKYRFSGAAMSSEDRMINPLGFQVTRYSRDAETLQETSPPIPSAYPAPIVPSQLQMNTPMQQPVLGR
jgi:type IV secretion system protein VirB8